MSLEQKIHHHIQQHGPMTVHRYMKMALSDPDYGYYTRARPIGKEGDFITAPEISQIFGELIGTWFLSCWEIIGYPKDFTLAELGPGKGTLMNDFLRVTQKIPSFHDAASLRMIEISETLRTAQQNALSSYSINRSWHNNLFPLPQKPLLLVANEFFDALPIHQLQLTTQGWRERMVDLDKHQKLTFTLSDRETPHCALAPKNTRDIDIGAIYEISPEGTNIMAQIADHIAHYGGIALIIDYGYYTQTYKDTLQSVKNHRYHDILTSPGTADLTMLVDFEKLAVTAREHNTQVYYNTTQGDFLRNMGIDLRLAMLGRRGTTEQQQQLSQAVHRLTSKDEMGTLFKCMAVSSSTTPPLFGFNDVFA